MRARRNLAAAAGGWSARHRRRTILGWLAFVLAAFAMGIATGVVQLTDVQQGNGQSKQPTAIYELVARLGAIRTLNAIGSPLQPTNRTLRSPDGR